MILFKISLMFLNLYTSQTSLVSNLKENISTSNIYAYSKEEALGKALEEWKRTSLASRTAITGFKVENVIYKD